MFNMALNAFDNFLDGELALSITDGSGIVESSRYGVPRDEGG